MGKPAARLGDMTSHAGSIVVGLPTVLIGGMPAARVGDMHVCPLLNPGVPPPPHVGGPMSIGSPTVLIGGMPAARMGDLAPCAGPPDLIALGCPTVLIGEAGGGAGGPSGMGMGTPASVAAQISSATAQTDNAESSTKQEHWVEFEFVDKAGKPVSGIAYKFTDPDGNESEAVLRLDGTIRRDGISQGQCKAVLMHVSNAKWSKNEADVGEEVELTAEAEGFEDGTQAQIQIYKRDIHGPDVVIETIEAEVSRGKIEAKWTYQLQPDEDQEDKEIIVMEDEIYKAPQYYFDVIVEHITAHSGILEYKDYIELELKDVDDKPVGGAEYYLYCPNGEVKKGKLDSNGTKKIEKIVPGRYRVRYPDEPNIITEV